MKTVWIIACITLCYIVACVECQNTPSNNVLWFSSTYTGKSTWFGEQGFSGRCSYQTNPFGNLVFGVAADITIYNSPSIPASACGMCLLVFGNQSTPQGGTTFADKLIPANNQPIVVWVVNSCDGCNVNGQYPGFDFYDGGGGAWLTNWTAIDCPVDAASGNPNGNVLINYVIQGGPNAYYQKLQLVGSRLPVSSLSFYNPTWSTAYPATRTDDNFWTGNVDTHTWSVLNIEFKTAVGSGQTLRDSIPLSAGGLTPASASGSVQFSQYRVRSSVPNSGVGGTVGGSTTTASRSSTNTATAAASISRGASTSSVPSLTSAARSSTNTRSATTTPTASLSVGASPSNSNSISLSATASLSFGASQSSTSSSSASPGAGSESFGEQVTAGASGLRTWINMVWT